MWYPGGVGLRLSLAGSAVAAAALLAATPAHAAGSCWMLVGGGAPGWKQSGSDLDVKGALSFDVGAGTSPDGAFIFGGLFRLAPILGQGTDLGLLVRGATHGFQAGDFGIAVDAGGYARFWGNESTGFLGDVTLGAPLGLQLTAHVMIGTDDAFAVGAVAGVDLLRLTVYRQTLLDWWTNPLPAQRASSPAGRWSF